jgi:cellulose synthase/poly-beta-1,6-N-acetylglucosamine synthase-like glycosyltransferase
VAVVLQLFGPIQQMHACNRYYSGQRPPRMKGPLPDFTVLMPVYKEGLESVLQPTIRSLQEAIKTVSLPFSLCSMLGDSLIRSSTLSTPSSSTQRNHHHHHHRLSTLPPSYSHTLIIILAVLCSQYELQGGSVNILVCDDGMQLLGAEDYIIRKSFYEANSIGYVARPGHQKGWLRAGRFKKSSNLNSALELSIRIEALMDERRPQRSLDEPWSYEEDQVLYEQCLQDALEETTRIVPPEGDDEKGKTLALWAAGNVRIGELILIIDSDTRVPSDCFLDAASEMHESPQCSIIQHVSDVVSFLCSLFSFSEDRADPLFDRCSSVPTSSRLESPSSR